MASKTPQVRRIFSKVAGVTMPNADGSKRQTIIAGCRSGEILSLVREPKNRHDKYAVKVLRLTGEQIGYLSESITGNDQGIGWCIGRRMDKGISVQARVKDVTGQDPRGVNIELAFWDGPVADEPKLDYLAERENRFCGGCGRPRAADANFCGECGFRFS